jgi:hypothetical protein
VSGHVCVDAELRSELVVCERYTSRYATMYLPTYPYFATIERAYGGGGKVGQALGFRDEA